MPEWTSTLTGITITGNVDIEDLLPGPTGGDPVNVGVRYVALTGNDSNDGLSWATAKRTISLVADSLTGHKGHIFIGAGDFYDVRIPMWQGLMYEGVSPSTTRLFLANNSNAPLFVTSPTYPPGEFLHWAGIKDMNLRGNTAGGNTTGNLIEFNMRIGENMILENLLFNDCPENGIRANNGGQPVFWRDLHMFGASSTGYAIYMTRQGGDIYQSVYLEAISGDNWAKGMFYFQNLSDRQKESVTLVGIKPETGGGGRQQDIVVLENTQCMVTIIGGSTVFPLGGSGNSVVKILPSTATPHVVIQGFASGHPLWIDDLHNGVQIPKLDTSSPMGYLHYQRGQVWFRLDGANYPPMFGVGLALADGITAPTARLGWAILYVDSVDGDLKVKFGDGTVKTVMVDT